ncbi:MAG: YeeE/YedE family protein [Pseudomonadota bacterium]
MKSVMALMAGLLFGTGLIVSGMSDPAKVLGFLDLAGLWDPSLALVMGGAVIVGLVAYPFAEKMPRSLLGDALHIPTATHIDRRLVLGALTFGAGWGLAGYCPGPALASLALGGLKPLLFSIAMLGGMVAFEMLEKVRAHAELSKKSGTP